MFGLEMQLSQKFNLWMNLNAKAFFQGKTRKAKDVVWQAKTKVIWGRLMHKEQRRAKQGGKGDTSSGQWPNGKQYHDRRSLPLAALQQNIFDQELVPL